MSFFETLKLYLRFKLIGLMQNLKFRLLNNEKFILIEGYPEGDNFGDALNVPLVKFLSGKKVVYSKFINEKTIEKNKKYAVIGSVIQSAKNNTIIWGAGFIKGNIENYPKEPIIHAVRGPKTRELFLQQGIKCPEVYGDPALILPLIYNPKVEKKYTYGLIPHIVDKNSEWIISNSKKDNVLIIDLEIGKNYKKVINELKSCKYIFSSSLHGLIIAYAYDIPCRHIRISDRLIGGNFKFNDFLLSIGKAEREPFLIEKNSLLEEIKAEVDYEKAEINLEQLINCCPFITNNSKEILIKEIKNDKLS